MPIIKDQVVDWFIRNIIMPKQEVMDQPGFILDRFSLKKQKKFLRELFLPEDFFSALEKATINKYGREGAKLLYSVGKKFGSNYSLVSEVPNIKNSKEKDISNYVYLFVRYVGSVWSKKIDYTIDLNSKIFDLQMDNFIICRKNGLGHMMTEGNTVGFWSYIVSDPNIEGVQITCQGRGDKYCKLICAPVDFLEKAGHKDKIIQVKNIQYENLDERYTDINQIRKPIYSASSLKDLIDSKFFNYNSGSITYKQSRYFLCESSLMDILDLEFQSKRGGSEILFEVAFEFGRNLAKNESNKESSKFITDYMSALGWGDVYVTTKNKKYMVTSMYYPWTSKTNKITFSFFSGVVSGMLSEFIGRKILLSDINQTLTSNIYVVSAKER